MGGKPSQPSGWKCLVDTNDVFCYLHHVFTLFVGATPPTLTTPEASMVWFFSEEGGIRAAKWVRYHYTYPTGTYDYTHPNNNINDLVDDLQNKNLRTHYNVPNI